MPKSMTRSTMTNNVWYRSMLVGNEPFSLGAYELIESNILTSSASSVTFSSIPQNYKHLQIRVVTRNARALNGLDAMTMQFNGDTGTNYASHRLEGNGSAVSAGSVISSSSIAFFDSSVMDSAVAGAYAPGVIDIFDYTNINKFKTISALIGGQSPNESQINLASGSWRSLNAVTSISIFQYYGFVSGSRFSLYGIKG